jgi:hypothetical protein
VKAQALSPVAFLTVALFALCASAADPAPREPTPSDTRAAQRGESREAMLKRREFEERIWELRPQRRDAPLREANISDYEIREVQMAAGEVIPKIIVNIGPVVTGCPCEDSPTCSDQVWITANRGNETVGLQLSKIKGVWQVGPVQKWWLAYDRLQSNRELRREYWRYRKAEAQLIASFPGCVGTLVPAEKAPAAKSGA